MISLIHYLWNVWEVSKNYDYYINMLMRQLPCILFISSIVWSNHGSRTTDWSKCLFLKRKYGISYTILNSFFQSNITFSKICVFRSSKGFRLSHIVLIKNHNIFNYYKFFLDLEFVLKIFLNVFSVL